MSDRLQLLEDGSERPELVFGLVGAAGTDLNKVAEELANELRTVGYNSEALVLSELISNLPRFAYLKQLIGKEEDARIRQSMQAGNELRRLLNNGDAVARLAISAIRDFREKANQEPEKPEDQPAKPVSSQAYIIKSLKHRGEYQSLAKVYGDRFIVASAYEPRQQRIENLARRIAKSHNKV